MNLIQLRRWVSRKDERVGEQRAILATLETIDDSIMGSRIGRFFGSTYLRLKWLILFVVGCSLVLIGGALFFHLATLDQYDEIARPLREDLKHELNKVVGTTMYEAIGEPDGTRFSNVDVLIQKMNQATEAVVNEEYLLVVSGFGFFAALLGIILLYIARLTRKMRIRNRKITRAEMDIQDLIAQVKEQLNIESEELERLREIIDPPASSASTST